MRCVAPAVYECHYEAASARAMNANDALDHPHTTGQSTASGVQLPRLAALARDDRLSPPTPAIRDDPQEAPPDRTPRAVRLAAQPDQGVGVSHLSPLSHR